MAVLDVFTSVWRLVLNTQGCPGNATPKPKSGHAHHVPCRRPPITFLIVRFIHSHQKSQTDFLDFFNHVFGRFSVRGVEKHRIFSFQRELCQMLLAAEHRHTGHWRCQFKRNLILLGGNPKQLREKNTFFLSFVLFGFVLSLFLCMRSSNTRYTYFYVCMQLRPLYKKKKKGTYLPRC
jgi:hypothetical protein